MKPLLKRTRTGALYHLVKGTLIKGPHDRICGDVTGIRGNASGIVGDVTGISGYVTGICGYVTGISGDVTGIRGDVSGIRGDVSGISGELDACEISDTEREAGVNISDLVLITEPATAE